MVEKVFSDSVYRFTEPPRYFKENDPYFYKVDNIPLKQIQENCLWLKDQLQVALTPSAVEVGREGFSELRPYVDGTNNTVKVKPGKFTARINDAITLTPMQLLSKMSGFDISEADTWLTQTNMAPYSSGIIDRFRSNLAQNSMSPNGLESRSYVFPMLDLDQYSQFTSSSIPGISIPGNTIQPPYPTLYGNTWLNGNPNITLRNIFNEDSTRPEVGFSFMGLTEDAFIKRWRGTVRTSIVNVEEELEIAIPAFDNNDFYYFNEQGNKILLEANQRIDLVFIYSKPIDASSTTISKFSNNTPTKILAPTLGIVKGAGIGVSKRTVSPASDRVNLTNVDGTPLILPSIADENAENIGFGDIKGSFPSPDDLMNLSPLLNENLPLGHIALIGQSVLPVAYVVVRKTASINSSNNHVIAIEDLIDIRPFFRTTELAYNERAGIAAATPQASIANPFVTEASLEKNVRSLFSDYNSKIAALQGSVSQLGGQFNNQISQNAPPTSPKVVGCGYVKGGYNFGVEGALSRFVEVKYNVPLKETQKQQVISRYGYHPQTVIADYPDWDISEWCNRGNFSSKGAFPNDYINLHAPLGPTEFGTFQNAALGSRLSKLGTDGTVNSCIYFVKKRVQIDRSLIGWASDYYVDAQFLNCVPNGNRGFRLIETPFLGAPGNAMIWIDKRASEFTIFVSWVASDQYGDGIQNSQQPYSARDNGALFAGFSVINSDLLIHDSPSRNVNGESAAAIAIYPTISFQVYGIPQSYQSVAPNLNSLNPTITLR